MGRNNTKAVKNIAKMYEQLGLAQDDIFHKTKLLLSIYRDVVWATLADCNCVNEEIYYYGDDLTDALVYLEEFAPDVERSEFERRVCNLFENKWMIDLIDKAMSKVYDYYNNGRLYHEILSKSYLTAFRYTESELLEILNLERSTFYDRKKEAVMLLGIALWGYAIPVFRGIFDAEGDESGIPEFFTSTEKSDFSSAILSMLTDCSLLWCVAEKWRESGTDTPMTRKSRRVIMALSKSTSNLLA